MKEKKHEGTKSGDFENGLASVTVGKGDDAKSGYIDKTGKVLWQLSN